MGSGYSVHPPPDHPPPEKLCEFKKLAADPEHYNIPEIPLKRQCTDKIFLGIFVSCLVILFIFITYASCNIHGLNYDNCGNVCGELNEHVEGVNCSGKDYREHKLLQINEEQVDFDQWQYQEYRDRVAKSCVKKCSPEHNFYVNDQCFILVELEFVENALNSSTVFRTHVESSVHTLWVHILNSMGWIILIVAVSGGLCVFMLVLFRYAPAFTIWAIIIVTYILMWIATIVLWISNDEREDDSLVPPNETRHYQRLSSSDLAILMTALLVLVTFLLIRTFKRIPQVISIFREATKAIFSMPLIILEPLLTVVAIVVTIVMFFVTTVAFCRAGVFTDIGDHMYSYRPNAALVFGLLLNTVMTLWIVNFIFACQIFVISGSVATWYFSRDKSFMGSPIRDALTCLVKFHLGSVAFGSLILTVLAIIKWILKKLAQGRKTRCLVVCILGFIQSVFEYISENAYIQVAMHGEAFYASGKRAVHLLCRHLSEATAVEFIGWLVLFMAELLIITFTIIFGIALKHENFVEFNLAVFVASLISFLVAHAMFRIFETAIQTIFLCYCEDCELNDGMDRPFYMSEELRQYFEESKAITFVVAQ